MSAQYAASASVPRRNPVVRAAGWVLALVVIVLVLAAIFLAVSLRHGPQGQTSFFGKPVYSVSSGSMTPTFDTGDLIVDKTLTPAAASHLHKGQVITFSTGGAGGSGQSLVITHRIVAVVPYLTASGAKSVEYRTKGDANNTPDQNLVPPSSVLGLYQSRIPFGGYVMSYLHQPITFVVLVMIPTVYLIGAEIRRRWIRLGETAKGRGD